MVSTIWGHWKLNEAADDALDSSGNSRDMTEAGTVSAQAGKINGARGVYSTSNYFSRANTIFSYDQSFSICAWVKCVSVPTTGTNGFVASNTGIANYFFVLLGWNPDTQKWYFYASRDAATSANKADTVEAGVWYWLCATYDASTGNMNIYIDNEVGTQGTKNTACNDSANMQIGIDRTYPSAYFYIDDVRIYSAVLSSTERGFIYNSGSGTESELSAAAKFRHFGKFWWKK